jgi:CSLREA domain-containing protein
MRAATLFTILLAVGFAYADVTVNTTTDADVDDAACSLREAIVAVNTNADYHGCTRTAAAVDEITFDVGTGTPTITVTGTDLPNLTGPTTIDGATGGATRVAVLSDGSRSTGLSFLGATDATGSSIKNLVVSGFSGRELLLSNGTGFTITGNFLGVDVTGTAFATGSGTGIEICTGFSCGTSGNHQIGGASAGLRNVIVANGTAIAVNASGNVIQGNFINTNAAGTQRLSPGFSGGISISNAAATKIGGPNAGEGNVITGFNVITIGGNPALAQSSNTVVQGNRIGTDVTGMVPLGGGGDGITVAHAVDTQIGGLMAGEGNVISGNAGGVIGGSSGVSGSSVDDTTVQGNFIGTDATGAGSVANSSFGVNLGDDAIIEGNVIAFNGNDGIEVNCGACIQHITANDIHSNGGIGIDLNGGSSGVTPNDDDDPDTGPNGRQNFPVLDAILFPGGTSISGTLNSTPSTTFRVEIFANDDCDPSGNGEGQEFVGAKDDVTTDAGGDATFTVTLSQSVAAGKVMTATAIAPNGSTSEFSLCTLPPPTTTSTSSTTSSSTSTSTSTTPTTVVTTSTIAQTTTTSSTTTSSSAAVPTTTSPVATTTTTTQPGCGGTPVSATFVSIDCRLDALLDDVNAESALGTFQPKLARNVEKARERKLDAEGVCRGSNLKKTKKRLQQSAKALTQFAHRLKGLPARRKLDAAVRQRFLDEAAPIEQDLRTLRGRVSCPGDAPPA